jgi:hypothetical protein
MSYEERTVQRRGIVIDAISYYDDVTLDNLGDIQPYEENVWVLPEAWNPRRC